MEILGHSQISLTMNTYGHVQPETQRDATSKIADLFGKRPQAPAEPTPAEEAAEEAQPGAVAEGNSSERAEDQDAAGAKGTTGDTAPNLGDEAGKEDQEP